MKTPWYFGWNIVAVSLVFQALIFGSILFSYTLWVGEWLDDPGLAVSLTTVMVPITVLSFTMSLMAPFAGRAMDRYSIRALVCIGAACAGLGFILIAHTTAFWQIIMIYGSLLTAGILLAGPLAAQTLSAKWFNKNRGLAMGLSTTGTSLGGVLMAPLVTALYQQYGWREAYWILGIAFIVLIVPLVWLTTRNTPEELGLDPEPHSSTETQGSQVEVKHWATTEILRERTFWVIIGAFLPLMMVFGSIQQHLRPIAGELGVGSMETAFLVSIFAMLMVVGKLFFGIMSDRIDHRYLFIMALIAIAMVNGGLLSAPAYPALVILTGLLGFAAGGFMPLMGAIVANRFGAGSFGSVVGLVGLFLAINAFGPMAFSGLFQWHGNYDLAFLAGLLFLIPSAIAIKFLPK